MQKGILVAGLATAWLAGCGQPSNALEQAPPEARSYASFEEYVVAKVMSVAPYPERTRVLSIVVSPDTRVACGYVQVTDAMVVPFHLIQRKPFPPAEGFVFIAHETRRGLARGERAEDAERSLRNSCSLAGAELGPRPAASRPVRAERA